MEVGHDDNDPSAGPLLPYRRTLDDAEVDEHLGRMQARWGVLDRAWHPIIGGDVPDDVVMVDARMWERDGAVDALRRILRAHGTAVVVVIRELGDVSTEEAIEAFDPRYDGAELLATNGAGDWLLYSSHEGTTALAGGPHVHDLQAAIADWSPWGGWERA